VRDFGVPQPTEWQRFRDQGKAAFSIFDVSEMVGWFGTRIPANCSGGPRKNKNQISPGVNLQTVLRGDSCLAVILAFLMPLAVGTFFSERAFSQDIDSKADQQSTASSVAIARCGATARTGHSNAVCVRPARRFGTTIVKASPGIGVDVGGQTCGEFDHEGPV
jgi:hypothetical protein